MIILILNPVPGNRPKLENRSKKYINNKNIVTAVTSESKVIQDLAKDIKEIIDFLNKDKLK